MPTMQEFSRYADPVGVQQYTAANQGIRFTVTGVQEAKVYFTAVSGAQDLGEYIEDKLEELRQKLTEDNVVPVDTGEYKESIDVVYHKGTYGGEVGLGEGLRNRSGESYAKYLIYGASTLWNAADHGRVSDDKKWDTAYTVGDLGILHDVRKIVYDWENDFFKGLETIRFAQPRVSGRFSNRPFPLPS